jgi:DNA-binding response OmpR family regulator
MPHILIVDDEPFQRMLIRETLSNNPQYSFSEAEDGVQAVARARNEHPDLMLLDVMMPHMNGFQVCRTLKTDPVLRGIPIILVTALDKIEDRVNGLDAGADDFINKPFEEEELQTRVRDILSRARPVPS